MTEQLFRWVKACEQRPEIWYASGGKASKRLNLIVQGYPSIGRYCKVENREFFEIISSDNNRVEFEKESFHLIEWLEQVSPSPVSGSLEDAAKDYADKVVPVMGVKHDRIITTREAVREDVQNAYLAGSSHSLSELDRLGKLLMEKDGEIEQRDNEIAKLKEGAFNKESFLKALRDADPNKNIGGFHPETAIEAWHQCVSKAAELLNQKEDK